MRASNAPSVAGTPGFATGIGSTLQWTAPGVSSDPHGDNLTARLMSPPANASLQLNLDGSFVFVPHPGFAGEDSFVLVVNDGLVGSANSVGAVLVGGRSVPTPPTAIAIPSIGRRR